VVGPLASLKTIPVPGPDNLDEFVKNWKAAIELGKALFWDMQVGSDGIQACASCHFAAGVDNRSKNQLNPGLLRTGADWQASPDTAFDLGGPNTQLMPTDFPVRLLTDPNDRNSAVLSDSNDVVGSQGIFGALFSDIVPGQVADEGTHEPDPIFQVGHLNVRRVEPRNTPTVINAVFNFRNFWDGRAQNDFNGATRSGGAIPTRRWSWSEINPPTSPRISLRMCSRTSSGFWAIRLRAMKSRTWNRSGSASTMPAWLHRL
jgi:hypothetical protein